MSDHSARITDARDQWLRRAVAKAGYQLSKYRGEYMITDPYLSNCLIGVGWNAADVEDWLAS